MPLSPKLDSGWPRWNPSIGQRRHFLGEDIHPCSTSIAEVSPRQMCTRSVAAERASELELEGLWGDRGARAVVGGGAPAGQDRDQEAVAVMAAVGEGEEHLAAGVDLAQPCAEREFRCAVELGGDRLCGE